MRRSQSGEELGEEPVKGKAHESEKQLIRSKEACEREGVGS